MIFIENLKRLSARSLYLIINIDDEHVQLSTDDIEWLGTIDELLDYINDEVKK